MLLSETRESTAFVVSRFYRLFFFTLPFEYRSFPEPDGWEWTFSSFLAVF